MVSSGSMISMAAAAVLCFIVPAILLIWFKKKEKILIKPVITGAIVFVLFALILERILHSIVISNNLFPNPILFSLYAALAAGVFEETGRFIAFRSVLKNNLEWRDGLAYGIGHGGIEAIIIGVVTNVQNLIFSNLINNGLFDSVVGSKLPAAQVGQINSIKEMLLQGNNAIYFLGVTERVFALGIQIALSLVVLYAVRNKKYIYLLLAIALHASLDIPAALYQSKLINNIYIIEGMIGVMFVAAVIFVVKSKKIFNKHRQ